MRPTYHGQVMEELHSLNSWFLVYIKTNFISKRSIDSALPEFENDCAWIPRRKSNFFQGGVKDRDESSQHQSMLIRFMGKKQYRK